MKRRRSFISAAVACLAALASSAWAQDLGPNVRKIKDGIFDDSERYYGLLVERVGAMVREGKSLDQITQQLRMPEYEGWSYQERMPSNIEAAYRAVTQR